MKMQALALGAALGFLAAITPSCGMQTCSTANCDGCCQGTMCVKRPDNALNSTCGTSGNACVNCAASNTTCDATTFTCATGPAGGGTAGGGTGGGTAGGGTTCDGCRLQNGACARRNSTFQNNNICGSNNDPCRSCVGTTTPVCDNGACIAPPKRVGEQCMQDSECQASLGPTASCLRTTQAGNFDYPGGYCSVVGCGASGTDDCPMGSICINLPRIFGENRTYCAASGCANPGVQSTCRAGYVCLGDAPNDPSNLCLPLAMFQDGRNLDTTSVVGNPCTNAAQCSAPTQGAPGVGGACFTEFAQLPDGGPRLLRDGGIEYFGEPGGSCTRNCRIDDDCVSDPDGTSTLAEGVCLRVSTTNSFCFKGCADPLGGQSSCRTGYVCEALTQGLADGGSMQLATGYCNGRCDVPGGGCPLRDGGQATCFPNGYCDFGGGRQDAGPRMVIDAGTGGDAGTVNDAGTTTDAGTVTDAGTATDAGTTADAGSTTCPDGGAVGADGGC